MCERSILKCAHNNKADLGMQIRIVRARGQFLNVVIIKRLTSDRKLVLCFARGQFLDLVIVKRPTSICKFVLRVREINS